MKNLTSDLNNLANSSRLNAIDSAYAGSPASQYNFKTQWQGYDKNGNGVVRYNGKNYSGSVISGSSPAPRSVVLLRVGKNIRNITS
jgi:hypothetical protein